MAEADMAKIRNCKTASEVNAVYSGREVIIQDNGPFHGQRADFVEMIGDTDRLAWRMKVKTGLGNYLFLKGGEFMMIFKTIEL